MRQRPDKSALHFFLHVIDNGDQIFNFTKYTSVPFEMSFFSDSVK